MRALALLSSALILTGCSTTTAAQEPAPNCVTVSDDVASALQAGIDMPDVQLTQFAAAPSPSTDGVWYVAANYATTDMDGSAVWATTQNPTGADAAFLSVDAVAETISSFNHLKGATAAAPGATDATNCLNQ